MLIQIVPSNRNTYRERKNTQFRYRQYRETEMHTERRRTHRQCRYRQYKETEMHTQRGRTHRQCRCSRKEKRTETEGSGKCRGLRKRGSKKKRRMNVRNANNG